MKKIISRSLYFIILYSAMAFAGDVEITSNTDPAGGYHVKTDHLFFLAICLLVLSRVLILIEAPLLS